MSLCRKDIKELQDELDELLWELKTGVWQGLDTIPGWDRVEELQELLQKEAK